MNRWPTKALGELAGTGQYGLNAAAMSEGTGVRFLRITDITQAGEIRHEEPAFVPSNTPDLHLYELNDGDVLIARSGATAGKSYVHFSFGQRAVFAGYLIRFQPDNSLVLPEFIGAFLQTPDYWRQLNSHKRAVAQPNVNARQLASIVLPVPPLTEQKRIVKLLDEAENLRKLRAQADRRTSDFIPALFQQLFGDAERNSRGWPTKAVGVVCDLVRGSSPRPKSDARYYGGPIPRLTIEDITRDGWLVTPRVDSLTELGASMSRPVKAGTLVMAVSGNVGLCSQLAVDACIHDGFVAFKDLHEDVFTPFFFGFTMSQMRQAHKRNQAGAIFQNVTTTDVKAMKIPIPPLALQEEFANRVAQVRKLEAKQAASRERIDALFQSMLHRAFRGEL